MCRHLVTGLLLGCLLPVQLQVRGQEAEAYLKTGTAESFARLEFNGMDFEFKASIEGIRLLRSGSGPGPVALEIPGYHPCGIKGFPALPGTSILFETGRGTDARIRILSMDSMIFDLPEQALGIMPYLPSARKGDSSGAGWRDSAVYSRDDWIGSPVFSLGYEGRMRGMSLGSLHFNPVRFNPARRQIMVYYRVHCSIEVPPSITLALPPQHAFSSLFDRVVRQTGRAGEKAVLKEEAMTLVILSDTLFREALGPLVRWKTRKGFRVIEAYTQDSMVGRTRESIKDYLGQLYSRPPEGFASPSFLLIVGDVDFIPLSQATGEVTDLYYAEYDGEGDYIPDIFYGRISVNSPEQLQGVVDKILEYEQFLFPDPSFLDEAVLIAGVDPTYASTYGNGQINYAHELYLNQERGINAHVFSYPESETSGPAIRELLSRGVGFVNYTGHGEWNEWIDPSFRISDIAGMQNASMYPVMIGNGCGTNDFKISECFAEALIRAPGKGALAYIGCTNDSYWDEDYFWAVGVGPVTQFPGYEETSQGYYDRVFHTHGEAPATWTPTLGEMIFGGNLAVQQSSSSRKKFYWQIYQLAGDPTLVPWFGRPTAQDISLPDLIPGGSGRVDVACAPYSYLALSRNGELLDALHASGEGYATLHLPDTLTGGNLELVISGEGFMPFVEEIPIGDPQGPYMELADYHLINESVGKDNRLTPGEEAGLFLRLVNRGDEAVSSDTLLLFSSSDSLEITRSRYVIELLEPGDTLEIAEAFSFRSDSGLADQSKVAMGIRLKGSGTAVYLKQTIFAPRLVSGGICWDDRPKGNGNGIPEPGEWLSCSWRIANLGHYRTGQVAGFLQQETGELVETVVFRNHPVLEPGDTVLLDFELKMADPGKGSFGSVTLSTGDHPGRIHDSFQIAAGRYLEDFRQGAVHFPFDHAGVFPWIRDSSSFSSSAFSLRSGKIFHGQESRITIAFETARDDSLSFCYRVSSEKYYDFLVLMLDSTEAGRWSGETGWNRYSIPLDAGEHRVSWVYRKDQNTAKGEDAAWIDDIIFPGTAFRKGDLALMEILEPGSGPWLSASETIRVRVSNLSPEPVAGFSIAFFVDGTGIETQQSDQVLSPGQSVLVTPSVTLDLSAIGSLMLEALVLSDTAGYAGNNRMVRKVEHYAYPDLALSRAGSEQDIGELALLRIRVENAGNIPLDTFHFELWLDSLHFGPGARAINLAPGETEEFDFILLKYVRHLDPGSYHYIIRSVDTDSVPDNHELQGLFVWLALNAPENSRREGWRVFPNPARGGMFVVLNEASGRDLLFDIVSPDGQTEGSFILPGGTQQLWIPLQVAAPGIYLLRLLNTGEAVRVVILP
jgi:hypothetical protein